MKLILIATLVMSFNSSFADEGLNSLRQSFNPLMSDYVKNLDLAKSLKPIESKIGALISLSQCEAVAENIRKASKTDPFKFEYETGVAFTYMCGGEYGTYPNYISNQTGTTQFNIPYNMIIQTKYSGANDKRLAYSNYYINSAYQIVQRESLSYDVHGHLDEFQVATKDSKGDFYNNYFVANMGYPQKNITGSTSVQTWVPNSGSVSSVILRNRIVDAKDPKKSFESLVLSRTDKQDFEAFELPITHGWSGGFFVYGGKYYQHPKFYSLLSIESKDDKEVCAFGSVTADGIWQNYPANSAEYYACVNM